MTPLARIQGAFSEALTATPERLSPLYNEAAIWYREIAERRGPLETEIRAETVLACLNLLVDARAKESR